MNFNQRKLKEQLIKILRIKSSYFELLLDQSIESNQLSLAKYNWSGKAYELVENQFDTLVLKLTQFSLRILGK